MWVLASSRQVVGLAPERRAALRSQKAKSRPTFLPRSQKFTRKLKGEKGRPPLALKEWQKYNTTYSRVVTHHSTDVALRSLACKIGRVCAFSSRCGRICRHAKFPLYKFAVKSSTGQPLCFESLYLTLIHSTWLWFTLLLPHRSLRYIVVSTTYICSCLPVTLGLLFGLVLTIMKETNRENSSSRFLKTFYTKLYNSIQCCFSFLK